jgi:rubrerythrin
MFTINEVLDIAIRVETNGESDYRNATRKTTNAGLISMLEWMADEEARHARWFADVKDRAAIPSKNPFLEEISRELFKDLMGEQSFALKDVDFSKVEGVEELLAIFLEFERDTVLFYEMLQPFVQDKKTLEQLDAIIAEEHRHIERLHEFLHSETESIIGGGA